MRLLLNLMILTLCVPVHAAILPERSKHALAWHLQGSRVAVTADSREYRLSGPLLTTRTAPDSGDWRATRRPLGEVSVLRLVRHDAPATASDPTLAISELAFVWRGTRFTATQAGDTYSLPFDGRLLLSLGPIGKRASRYRLTGCVGVVADNAGDLAGRHG